MFMITVIIIIIIMSSFNSADIVGVIDIPPPFPKAVVIQMMCMRSQPWIVAKD